MTAAGKYRQCESVNLYRLLPAVLSGAEDLMADLNVEQMMEGQDAKGEPLYFYRSPVYAELKQRMNSAPAFGVADFRVDGTFHRSLFASVDGDRVTFNASDQNTSKLLELSPNMFGLTTESTLKLKETYLQDAVILSIKDVCRL